MDVVSRAGQGTSSIPSEGPATGHFLQPKWGNGPWGVGDLRDRLDVVLPFFKGEKILDVGCASRFGKSDWLHGLIAASFPIVVGIDIREDAIGKIQSQGFEAHVADAQDFDLEESFDTVFAGEIIEHLDNVHGFLQVHPEHTCWFCEDTLRRVLTVNSFSHIEISFSGHSSPTPLRKAATFAAQHLLPPRLALDTLIAVAVAA